MIAIFRSIRDYFSLVKFSHTVFAMPFALIGFSLAVARPEFNLSIRLLLLVILCMIFARNTAMGFNRLADKDFDALNPRTKKSFESELNLFMSITNFYYLSFVEGIICLRVTPNGQAVCVVAASSGVACFLKAR